MADAEPEAPIARGQPLKQFVENWEFRWDVQRDLYPWEWGQGGNLSDGPYNIIRCVPFRRQYIAMPCTARSSLTGQSFSTRSHPYVCRYGQPPPKGWQKRNQP